MRASCSLREYTVKFTSVHCSNLTTQCCGVEVMLKVTSLFSCDSLKIVKVHSDGGSFHQDDSSLRMKLA